MEETSKGFECKYRLSLSCAAALASALDMGGLHVYASEERQQIETNGCSRPTHSAPTAPTRPERRAERG